MLANIKGVLCIHGRTGFRIVPVLSDQCCSQQSGQVDKVGKRKKTNIYLFSISRQKGLMREGRFQDKVKRKEYFYLAYLSRAALISIMKKRKEEICELREVYQTGERVRLIEGLLMFAVCYASVLLLSVQVCM